MNPLMFKEEISQCKTEANFNESQITLSNCTHNDVANISTRIVMINCSSCIQLYVIGGLFSDFSIVLRVKKSGLGLLSALSVLS